MTAIIVTTEALPEAIAISGDQFTVPLSSDGAEPASHMGCNWVGCPTDVQTALAALAGATLADSWAEALAAAQVTRVVPQDQF